MKGSSVHRRGRREEKTEKIRWKKEEGRQEGEPSQGTILSSLFLLFSASSAVNAAFLAIR
jgi:hypothetical protein